MRDLEDKGWWRGRLNWGNGVGAAWRHSQRSGPGRRSFSCQGKPDSAEDVGSPDARSQGSLTGQHLDAPIVGIDPTSAGNGYWLVASDGGVFTCGDAPFAGSLGGQPLSALIVGT